MFLKPQHKIIIALLTSSIQAQTTQICDSTSNATTNSGRYTFFPDVVATDDSGYQCTDFTLADDTTTNTTLFTTTFSWSGTDANTSTPHSFPSLTLNLPSILPIPISNISLLPLTNNWALYPGNPLSTISSTSASSLQNVSVIAACYLTLYLDLTPETSQNASLAATKIIIWQASYGGLLPLGYTSTSTSISRPSINLAGITYTLYTSQSSPSTQTQTTWGTRAPAVPQTVYSWYPDSNTSSLTAMDVSPLLNYLWREVYVDSGTYVGYVEWGLDARHATGNVTWSVYEVGMNVKRGTPVKAVGGGAGRDREVGRGEMVGLVVCLVGAVVLFG
ncbi:glycoside hydrolase family 12 protein [Sclerotinia borealis F-4128]|uniref:Glycoside hydrolase family 12 protein n=1 Tax=Sclerotinia borealis (strain F-4128) TaxID=1432307 RepID=W9C4D0_SCLBF|nr:glycoside hydrolase family 12 protein [Sclerotinia borealis F-4128]